MPHTERECMFLGTSSAEDAKLTLVHKYNGLVDGKSLAAAGSTAPAATWMSCVALRGSTRLDD